MICNLYGTGNAGSKWKFFVLKNLFYCSEEVSSFLEAADFGVADMTLRDGIIRRLMKYDSDNVLRTLCIAIILNPNLDISGVLPDDIMGYREDAMDFLLEKTQQNQKSLTSPERPIRRENRNFSDWQNEPLFIWNQEVWKSPMLLSSGKIHELAFQSCLILPFHFPQ
jgi:hypothetical protein